MAYIFCRPGVFGCHDVCVDKMGKNKIDSFGVVPEMHSQLGALENAASQKPHPVKGLDHHSQLNGPREDAMKSAARLATALQPSNESDMQ